MVSQFTLKGRIDRTSFLMSLVFAGLIYFSVSFLLGLVGFFSGLPSIFFSFVHFMVGFCIAIYCFTVTARRLHDLDQTGWLALISFVPIFNFILYGVLLI